MASKALLLAVVLGGKFDKGAAVLIPNMFYFPTRYPANSLPSHLSH